MQPGGGYWLYIQAKACTMQPWREAGPVKLISCIQPVGIGEQQRQQCSEWHKKMVMQMTFAKNKATNH